MKIKLISIALVFASITSAFAGNKIQEDATKDVKLVPAIRTDATQDQKPCAVANKSLTRTITVRIEESTIVNNFLEKKTITFEKIGPNEHKFLGFAGCDDKVLYNKCTGYKILVAYYDDNISVEPTQTSMTINNIGGKEITSR